MNTAYNSDDCEIFSKALDHAWEMFLKTGDFKHDNHDTARAALTYAILNSARTGERNPRKLAADALTLVNAYQPAIQERRSYGLNATGRR